MHSVYTHLPFGRLVDSLSSTQNIPQLVPACSTHLIRLYCPNTLTRMVFLERKKVFLAAISLSLVLFSPRAAEQLPKGFAEPKVAGPSDGGEMAMKGFVVAPGFKLEVFAAEPHLANPVAFTVDEQGRFYVVETFRLHAGVTDIRGHMDWLDEDLAARTPDDRLALMKRHEGERFPDYEKYSDRLKQIV